jgi:hypothetical protein
MSFRVVKSKIIQEGEANLKNCNEVAIAYRKALLWKWSEGNMENQNFLLRILEAMSDIPNTISFRQRCYNLALKFSY